MLKKLIPILMAVFILTCIPAVVVRAAITTSGSCGDNAVWNYDISTQTLTISGSGTVLHSDDWNSFYSSISKVVINEGITAIGESAFAGTEKDGNLPIAGKLPNFTEVSLPSTLKTISRFSFMGNQGLLSISIPEGLTYIGELCFAYCPSLTTVFWGPKNPDAMVTSNRYFGFFSYNNPYLYTSGNDDALTDFWFNGTEGEFKAFDIGTPSTCTMHYNLSDLCGETYINYQPFYTGKPVEPTFSVATYYDELVQGRDYEITYRNNINAGIAMATITGIGNYSGSFQKAFIIERAESSMTARLSSSAIYSGNTANIIVKGNAGTVTYSVGKSVLAKAKICTVTRSGKITAGTIKSSNGEDTCVITVKDPGDANHTGKTIKLSLNITRCATPKVTVRNTAKGPKVTWKKTKGASEWAVYRCKIGTTKWVAVTRSTKTCSLVDKKAVKNKTYMYRVICINSKAKCQCSAYGLSKQIKVKK